LNFLAAGMRSVAILIASLLVLGAPISAARADEESAEAQVQTRGAPRKKPVRPTHGEPEAPDPNDEASADSNAGAKPTSAAATAGKSKKPGIRVEQVDGRYLIRGRPENFDSRASPAGAGQDRRHVIHYSQSIRDPYAAAANRLIETQGKRAFLRESQAQLEKYDLLGRSPIGSRLKRYFEEPGEPEPDEALVTDVMRFSVNRLNSTPNNLISDTAFENQEIETTRKTMARARAQIGAAKDAGEAIEIALDAVPLRQGTGERAEFGNEHRLLTRQLIQACPNRTCVEEVLEDVEFSTALDLPKAPGQIAVNEFALFHEAKMRRVKAGEISDGAEALRAVFDINNMPSLETAPANAVVTGARPKPPARTPAAEGTGTEE